MFRDGSVDAYLCSVGSGVSKTGRHYKLRPLFMLTFIVVYLPFCGLELVVRQAVVILLVHKMALVLADDSIVPSKPVVLIWDNTGHSLPVYS